MDKVVALSNYKYFEPINGLKAKIVNTNNSTYAFWEIEKGTILPEHQHFHEQVSIVTKGELELTIAGNTSILKKGMIALIPPNTNHSAKAIKDVELTDVFTPIREDFPDNQIK